MFSIRFPSMKKLTIFQKVLAAPAVGLALYIAYMLYTYHEHNVNHERMSQLQSDYLPVLKAIGDNLVLFDNINKGLKDAVISHEEEWVEQTRDSEQKILSNLSLLQQHSALISTADVQQLRHQFQLYYRHAVAFSLAMIHKNQSPETLNQLIEQLEKSRADTADLFNRIDQNNQQRFQSLINSTTQSLNQLIFVGIAIGLFSILVLASVAYVASRSTSISLKKVIDPMRDLAEGKPTFDKRLVRYSDDEMGELVDSFNLLTDKLERDYRAIEQLSITDKLTQLYNRAKMEELFEMELNQIQRYQIPFSIILIDLDHFKSVNDTYGHLTGDKVLQELADVLRNNVRSTDYLGRIGGEEFLIIATHADLEQTLVLAENLRVKIEAFDFTEVGQKTGSLGVATWHPGDNDTSMLQRADECLYYAKEHGRNQVVSEEVLEETASLPCL